MFFVLVGKAAFIYGDVFDFGKLQAGVVDFVDACRNDQLFWQSEGSQVDFSDDVRECDLSAGAVARGCPLVEQHRIMIFQPQVAQCPHQRVFATSPQGLRSDTPGCFLPAQ